jgi:hypothetical protein
VWPQTPSPAQQPKGVEVLARGPVHEAFATPGHEAKPNYAVPKRPPVPLEEMPPEERPEGEVVWIGGYWAWDDDRQDFLWVSGCWRAKPLGKDWVPGYWREVANQWQWVSGLWTQAEEGQQAAEVTYLPEPPAPPQLAPPGDPPAADMFFVPGYWHYSGERYVWRVGYWTRSRTGYVYVASHYRWTPHGHVFVAGYWDYAVPRRGVLYAPIVVDPVVVGPRFVYTPYYAVSDTVVVDFLFVRPGFCHYYFGDYYGPRYATLGFECCYTYGRRHYDPIVCYRRWEYRDQPRWLDVRIGISIDRSAGRAWVPPRTLVQQNNIVQNNITNVTNVRNVNINSNNTTQVLAPTRTIVANQGAKTVPVDADARMQAARTAQAVQKTASLRQFSEGAARPVGTPITKPAVKNIELPTAATRTPRGPAPAANVGDPNPTKTPRPMTGTPLSKSPATTPPGPGANTKAPVTFPAPGANTSPPGTPAGQPKGTGTPTTNAGPPKTPMNPSTNPPANGGQQRNPMNPGPSKKVKSPPPNNDPPAPPPMNAAAPPPVNTTPSISPRPSFGPGPGAITPTRPSSPRPLNRPPEGKGKGK